MEAPTGAVRAVLTRESRKAVGVRVPLLPPWMLVSEHLTVLKTVIGIKPGTGSSPVASAIGS